MNKKLLAMLTAALMLGGCGQVDSSSGKNEGMDVEVPDTSEDTSFWVEMPESCRALGTVYEVTDDYVGIVLENEGETHVSRKGLEKFSDLIDGLVEGDLVAILYTGGIMETYPAVIDSAISIEYAEASEAPGDETYIGSKCAIVFTLPEGWVSEMTKGEGNDITIRVAPEGSEESLDICWRDTMGLCGTGLTIDDCNYSGMDAKAYFYDGAKYWQFINFTGDYEHFWIISHASDEFMGEQLTPIDELLNSLKFSLKEEQSVLTPPPGQVSGSPVETDIPDVITSDYLENITGDQLLALIQSSLPRVSDYTEIDLSGKNVPDDYKGKVDYVRAYPSDTGFAGIDECADHYLAQLTDTSWQKDNSLDRGDIIYSYKDTEKNIIAETDEYYLYQMNYTAMRDWYDGPDLRHEEYPTISFYMFMKELKKDGNDVFYTGDMTADAIQKTLDIYCHADPICREVTETDDSFEYKYYYAYTSDGDWGMDSTATLTKQIMTIDKADGRFAASDHIEIQTCSIPGTAIDCPIE